VPRPGRIFASAFFDSTYVWGQPLSSARGQFLSANCNPLNCNDLDRGQLSTVCLRGRIAILARIIHGGTPSAKRKRGRPTLQIARSRRGGGRGAGVPRLPPVLIAPGRLLRQGPGSNFQRTTLECGRLLPLFKKACPTDQARSRWLPPHLKAATQHVRIVESLHPYSTREPRPRATRRRDSVTAR
jgi:hypothetical protein